MGAFHGVERGASVVDDILPPPHTQLTAQTSCIVTKIPYHRGRRFQRPRNCGAHLFFYLGHSKIGGVENSYQILQHYVLGNKERGLWMKKAAKKRRERERPVGGRIGLSGNKASAVLKMKIAVATGETIGQDVVSSTHLTPFSVCYDS